jgi:hypothetical protein
MGHQENHQRDPLKTCMPLSSGVGWPGSGPPEPPTVSGTIQMSSRVSREGVIPNSRLSSCEMAATLNRFKSSWACERRSVGTHQVSPPKLKSK